MSGTFKLIDHEIRHKGDEYRFMIARGKKDIEYFFSRVLSCSIKLITKNVYENLGITQKLNLSTSSSTGCSFQGLPCITEISRNLIMCGDVSLREAA